MPQHFLLSAAARTLSLVRVARMTDEEARATFRAIRWASTQGGAGHRRRPPSSCRLSHRPEDFYFGANGEGSGSSAFRVARVG